MRSGRLACNKLQLSWPLAAYRSVRHDGRGRLARAPVLPADRVGWSPCMLCERAGLPFLQEPFVSNTLARFRAAAFALQGGRCFYCKQPMWLSHPEAFAARHGLTFRQVRWLQATAEHLHARKDGGSQSASNIVAACRLCNLRRHARKAAPCPQDYERLVMTRMAQGRWHPFKLARDRPRTCRLSTGRCIGTSAAKSQASTV